MTPVRKGDTGLAVGRVQQALIEAGYSIPQTEIASLTYGDGTYATVRSFQASHIGPTGQPLGEDGIVGDQTWWALQNPGAIVAPYKLPGWFWDYTATRNVLKPVLQAAVDKIGVHEIPDGSNDGPDVRVFTAPDFIGDPWCACFVSWAYAQLTNGSPFGRIAATWAFYDWAKANSHLVVDGDALLPGDVALILRGDASDPKRRGHTMMVTGVLSDNTFATVAGNESNSVRGGIRTRDSVSAIVRPIP